MKKKLIYLTSPTGGILSIDPNFIMAVSKEKSGEVFVITHFSPQGFEVNEEYSDVVKKWIGEEE